MCNYIGLERYVVASTEALLKGASTVKYDFAYYGGGKGIISINGKEVANSRIEKTQPNIFSADETADVGLDNQTPVALGIGYGPEETKFTGKINKIVVELN